MDSSNKISLKTPLDGVESYYLLNTLEFTSARKRQSSILQDEQGKIFLYTKGADNVIIDRLYDKESDLLKKTGEFVDEFAEDGLRTLYLAKK